MLKKKTVFDPQSCYGEVQHQQFHLIVSYTFSTVIILSGSNFFPFPPSARWLILK